MQVLMIVCDGRVLGDLSGVGAGAALGLLFSGIGDIIIIIILFVFSYRGNHYVIAL